MRRHPPSPISALSSRFESKAVLGVCTGVFLWCYFRCFQLFYYKVAVFVIAFSVRNYLFLLFHKKKPFLHCVEQASGFQRDNSFCSQPKSYVLNSKEGFF